MNDLTRMSGTDSNPATRVARLFEAQRAAFLAHPYPACNERKAKLKALKKQISRYQDVLARGHEQGLWLPFATESKMLDLLGSMLDVDHTIAHVRRWMKPSRRTTELLFFSNSLHVNYQPKGVVGIIVPWNFPVYLALGPLITALAAGNRVMIKMSEITPATNAVLARLLGEIFSEDEVALVGEELPNTVCSPRCLSTTSCSPDRPLSARSSCAPLRRT